MPVVGGSVQIIENFEAEEERPWLWMVALFCSSNRFNLWYPQVFFPDLARAKSCAFDMAVHHRGGPVEQTGRDSFIAGADPRSRISIHIVRWVDE